MQDVYKKLCAVTLLLCLATAMIYLLMPVGLQDSGALAVTENGLGISKAASTYGNGNAAEMQYRIIGEANPEIYRNAAAFYTVPLIALCKTMGIDFDMRLLGFLYLLLMLTAVCLVLRYGKMPELWQNILLAALLWLVFFDAAYLVWCNTLYSEIGFLVFCFLAVALYGKMTYGEKPGIPALVLYYLCAFLLCGMKPNMAFAGIFFALMGLRLIPLQKKLLQRLCNGLLALLIAVTPFFTFGHVSSAARESDLYNAVFYGILKDNENPHTALEKLGLSGELAVYVSVPHFQADLNAPLLRQEFFEKVSYGDVVKYYLTTPKALWKKWRISANNGFENRPRYLGNYTAGSGKDPAELAGGFTLYSSVKRRLFPAKAEFLLLFAVLAVIGAIYLRRQTAKPGARAFCDGAVLLTVLSVILSLQPVMTFGESELARHMAVYGMLFDILFVTAVCGAVLIVTQRRNTLKEKYGINQ